MAKSFFEKLKKGMGIELPVEEPEKVEIQEIEVEDGDEEEVEEKVIQKTKKRLSKKKSQKKVAKRRISKKEILKTKKIEGDMVEEKSEEKEDWFVPEGQLSIDVYQTKNELVIQSAIAGIKTESLDIALEGDVITVKGSRKKPQIEEEADYFTQECHWGKFSREIILPVETDPNRAKASMKEGILTIRIPKIFREKKRKISVKKIGE